MPPTPIACINLYGPINAPGPSLGPVLVNAFNEGSDVASEVSPEPTSAKPTSIAVCPLCSTAASRCSTRARRPASPPHACSRNAARSAASLLFNAPSNIESSFMCPRPQFLRRKLSKRNRYSTARPPPAQTVRHFLRKFLSCHTSCLCRDRLLRRSANSTQPSCQQFGKVLCGRFSLRSSQARTSAQNSPATRCTIPNLSTHVLPFTIKRATFYPSSLASKGFLFLITQVGSTAASLSHKRAAEA